MSIKAECNAPSANMCSWSVWIDVRSFVLGQPGFDLSRKQLAGLAKMNLIKCFDVERRLGIDQDG